MSVVNFGSLNYDYVYFVDHIVLSGETISSYDLSVFCGGKGLNQSIALSLAGADVFHAGLIGEDGDLLLDTCNEHGVKAMFIQKSPVRSGNAIIQVSKTGQNSIVLFGGANRQYTEKFVDEVLSFFKEGDYILLQNEINLVDYIIDQAYAKNMIIVLNPSPYNDSLNSCDLKKVSFFILNEVEGMQITGETDPEKILPVMLQNYPDARIVLTLGKSGVMYADQITRSSHGIYDVEVIDTTAAGDTFTGYFIASIIDKKPIEEALRIASIASSLAVAKKGAVASIPRIDQVLAAQLVEL